MIILRILKPKHIPYHKTDWNWWLRLYYWIIRALLPIYKRSAISDTIILGNTQVFHNVRDYWYEQELQRFHIDAALDLEKRSIPYNASRKFRHSRLFRWSDSLLILHEGGRYSIKRAKDTLIDTNKEGSFKLSTEKDFIIRSEFVAKEDRSQQDNNSKQTDSHDYSETSIKQESSSKIKIKDTVPTDKTDAQQSYKLVKHQGFEEIDLF